ncbi:MAG: DUF4366 domain-containing protein [Oribacterium sp.]|nr:DUF4366 domain-containing protein [Oribacterium sp.]
MQKILIRRIVASLILSVMLFALPVGAFLANSSTAVQVFAEDDVSGNETDGDGEAGENNDDNSGDESDEGGETGETGEEGEEEPTPTPEPKPECICDSKCSQYDHNDDCPVCSVDYTKCEYVNPNVKITINTPSGWYSSGTNAKITFKVEDIADSGHFAIKSVRAKIGQNGSYQDVTEDMFIEISENCTLYVLVTDANDKSYERSRAIKCFDTTKPTLNAAVSDGLLTVQAVDKESGIKVIYVNGYEFTDGITNGTLNIRLSQFDAGYEYFTITAMDQAGNVSEVYKTKNPYYKDPNSDDDSNPAEQLPTSAQATNPSSATANVTQHTQTDSNGNTTSQTPKTPEEQKKEEFARADAEEEAMKDAESEGEDMNLGKEFYTIQAASGKVFYLIIDRDGEEEVVYFLTEITENDLLNVTSDNSETLPKNSAALESQIPVTESALPNNNTEIDDTHEVETPVEETTDESVEETEEEPEAETEEPVKSNPLVGYLIMGIFGAGVIGAAYYFKVVKKKQDGDFVEDEDEEDDDEEYESESEESETDGDDDFFNDQETESERPAPTAEDVADTIEDEDGDPYESDSDEE